MSTIDDIRQRWQAATPGPWFDTDQPDGVLRVSFYPLDGEDGGIPYWVAAPHDDAYAHSVAFPGDMEMYEGADLANARFIAASWADVRDLLAEVDRLRGALLALVALPPLRYHEMRCYCHHCGAQLPDGNSGHEADCAWVLACDLVAGEAVRP